MNSSDIEWTLDLGSAGEVDVLIEYNWSGGHPGTPPSLSYPGDPPEPPEIEFTKITMLNSGEVVDYDLDKLGEDDRLIQAIFEKIEDSVRYDYDEW